MPDTRPPRPSDALLEKLGIFYLPANVDIIEDTASPIFYSEVLNQYASCRAYYFTKYNEQGDIVMSSHVPTLTTSERTEQMVNEAARRRLVTNYGAIPRENGLITDLRPGHLSEQFLIKAGVPTPLPRHITAKKEERGCMLYLVIKNDKTGTEDIVELRHTRANNMDKIFHQVREKFFNLGVTPTSP